MKSTDVNLSNIQTQPSSIDEPEPTLPLDKQNLINILLQIVSKKYDLNEKASQTLIKNKFNRIKALSIDNPDKVTRSYNIFPISDENICKYLIEKEKMR